MTMTAKKCDVCGVNEPIGVASSNCGAVSFAYCKPCVNAGAEPYGALVAYLSCAVDKGEDLKPEAGKIVDGYQRVIDVSLKVAGKTREEFYADVDKALEEEREYFGSLPKEDETNEQ